MAPLGRHAGRWELVGQVLTWSPPTLFCHSAVVTAPGHHVVNVPPIAKFISTWDEPGECGVICKVLEFDRLVSRDAAVGVKGEEQGIKYRSLKATDADALKVCDMHSQSHMLLPVRQEVSDPHADGSKHIHLGELVRHESWDDKIITDFVMWCELNPLHQLMLVGLTRKPTLIAQVNTVWTSRWWTDTESWAIFLIINWNKKQKGQSQPSHLLDGLRSSGVCTTLLRIFYDTVIASTVFYTVVCQGGGSKSRDRKWLYRLAKPGSVLAGALDHIEEEKDISQSNIHYGQHIQWIQLLWSGKPSTDVKPVLVQAAHIRLTL